MADDKKRILIRSYLFSQATEFNNGTKRIFKMLGLEENIFVRAIFFITAAKSSIHYLEYLEGRIGIPELKRMVQKEITITYRLVIERSGIHKTIVITPDKRKMFEARRLEFLHNYAEPIFFNFDDDIEELKIIFHNAETLAKEKEMHPDEIFKNHREELLRRVYNPKEMEKRLRKLFSFFSVKETLEKLNLGDSASAETIRTILDEKRQKENKMQKLAIALEIFIGQRTAEIFTNS